MHQSRTRSGTGEGAVRKGTSPRTLRCPSCVPRGAVVSLVGGQAGLRMNSACLFLPVLAVGVAEG